MIKYLFKNKWMYLWVLAGSVSVYGGSGIIFTATALLWVWMILDILDTYGKI